MQLSKSIYGASTQRIPYERKQESKRGNKNIFSLQIYRRSAVKIKKTRKGGG